MNPAMGGMPSLSYGTTATSGAHGGMLGISNLLNKGAVTINYGDGTASSVAPLAISHNMILLGVAAAVWFFLKK